MRNINKMIFPIMVLMVLLILAACSGDTKTGGSETKADTSSNGETNDGGTVPQDAIEVNIGYSGPLSGPAAFYGENTLSGLRIAVDEINGNGGFEVDGQLYEINLVTLDDQYLPNQTGANVLRLKEEYGASVVFIPHSGGIYASQVFNEESEILIAAYTSESGVTETGNSLTLRIPPRYKGYMEPFTQHAMEISGKRIAFLPTASQYGKDWAETLAPVWEANGGEIVYNAEIDFRTDTDFFTIVTNALQTNPDVLFVGGPSEPTALVIKQARELGFEGGFLIMDQAKMDEIAAALDGNWDYLEDSIGVLPLTESKFPGTPQFIKLYNSLHGKNPGSEAGYHYLAMYVLVDAMKAAGSVSDEVAIIANIQNALDVLPDDKKVYDIQKIEEDGGFYTPLRIAIVKNGELTQFNIDEEQK